jgi:hypothetical protein
LAVAQGILLGMLSMSPTIQYGLILVIKQEPLFTTLEWQFATGQSWIKVFVQASRHRQ